MKASRPHQDQAVALLKKSIASGKRRPMLQISTGGGKTFVAAMITQGARAKGNRVCFFVDAISLIDQTVERFNELGITEIGVIQSDHPMMDYKQPVQIASIQTAQNKPGLPPGDIYIVDEAHVTYRRLLQQMADSDKVFIGLSATPWTKGLGNHYDDLIQPITMQGLMDEGYLCPFRVFAPSHPDLSKVKTVAGDYQEDQLAAVMGEDKLLADIVRTWLQRGENRPTIAFCVDRAHAQLVQQRFLSAGVGCGYIDGKTSRAERKAIEEQLNRGELQVVASVGCLTKGVDWSIGCIILARPTKSEMLYTQMVGRGLRVNPEAGPDCIILDHSDTTLRLGFVTDIDKPELCKAKGKEKQKPTERKEPLPKECPSCSFLKPPKVSKCPQCSFEPTRESEIREGSGQLVELGDDRKPKKEKFTKEMKQEWYSGLIHLCKKRGYQPGWVAQKYRQKFGVWPQGLNDIAKEPGMDLVNWENSERIRWAKGKGRQAA